MLPFPLETADVCLCVAFSPCFVSVEVSKLKNLFLCISFVHFSFSFKSFCFYIVNESSTPLDKGHLLQISLRLVLLYLRLPVRLLRDNVLRSRRNTLVNG